MYTITLEVNQICNLRCDYCYLGEKTNQIMPEEIACKGIEIAFLNVEKHKDKRLWVDFVGGEALISFALLRKLVEYIEADSHPYFVATQAHPEFKSRPSRPHPLFVGLIKAAKN